MKIYFAGEFDRGAIETKSGLTRYLITYADLMQETDRTSKVLSLYQSLVDNHNFEYFLDSGAFSVFQKNATIDIDDYISFIKRYRKLFSAIAALDVIGSGFKSYQNYLHMYDAGITDCIPAWHYGDDKILIKKYLDKTDYIAIGNLVPLALKPQLRAQVIRKTINIMKSFNPQVKIHLYGMTSLIMLKMFGTELESVDSKSWLSGRMYAQIYSLNGNFDYHGRIPRGDGLNTHRINIYNAEKFLEIERFINEQKVRSKYKDKNKKIRTAAIIPANTR